MNIMTMTTIIHIHLKMTVFLQVMVIIFRPFILIYSKICFNTIKLCFSYLFNQP